MKTNVDYKSRDSLLEKRLSEVHKNSHFSVEGVADLVDLNAAIYGRGDLNASREYRARVIRELYARHGDDLHAAVED